MELPRTSSVEEEHEERERHQLEYLVGLWRGGRRERGRHNTVTVRERFPSACLIH